MCVIDTYKDEISSDWRYLEKLEAFDVVYGTAMLLVNGLDNLLSRLDSKINHKRKSG